MPILLVERPMPNGLLVRMSGNWRQGLTVPGMEQIQQALDEKPASKSLEFDTIGLTGWDSRFVAFVS